MGGGGREALFSHPSSHKTDDECGHLSHARNFGAGLPTPPLIVLTLLCCPGEVQGTLPCVWQLMGVGDGSPTLMITGPALPSASGVDGWEEGLNPQPILPQDR